MRTTRTREISLQGLLWLLLVPVALEIGEGLFFGLFIFAAGAAVTVYFRARVNAWERGSSALLYRERGLFHWKPRYVRAVAEVDAPERDALTNQ